MPTLEATAAGRDPRLLRGGPDRARLPRGRRAARLRTLHGSGGERPSRGAVPRGLERRSVRDRLRRVRGRGRGRARADGDRRGGRRQRSLGSGPRTSCRRRAKTGRDSPSTSSSAPPEPGETGLRPATRGRLRPAGSRLRGGAPRGDRDRPARARPRELSLAHADADRGRALVDLGGRRHDPVQGGGVGVDAVGGAAPAGLGRPGRARPEVRAARACATSAGSCSSACPPSASSCAPRTRRRSGSTRRSACAAWPRTGR